MLNEGQVKEIYEMKRAARFIRWIAVDLGIARNTVRRYLNSPEAIRPRRPPASKLDPFDGIRRPQAGGEVGELRGAAPGVEEPGL